MAHEIQTMAYVDATPWHGLGNPLTPHQPIEVWQKEAGMDWRINETEVLYSIAGGNGLHLKNNPEHKVLFRSDTALPLSVVSKRYPCPSPAACELGRKGGCKPYGRLNVSIGDEDPLGSFIFRTTSFNSIRTLTARLQYFRAISRNRLSCLPLELRLRGKSTRQSHGTPIYYVDVTVRTGLSLEESLVEAKRIEEQRQAAGFDQEALELSARQGLANGAFEESDEEAGAVAEAFFPATSGEGDTVAAESVSAIATVPDSLAEKLAVKAHSLGLAERQA